MPIQVVMTATGQTDVLKVVETPDVSVKPGEVKIRQEVAGVNFVDIYHRKGWYPVPAFPAVPGVEAVGVIEQVGPDVSGWSVGERAAYVGFPIGGYTQSRIVRSEQLIRPPAQLTSDQAGTMLLRGTTTYMILEHVARLQPGQTILIHAAAGGLGLYLVQWAKLLGARTIGTVGDRQKAELALSYGLDHVILYKEQDFVKETLQLSGKKGVDLAIDGIGGENLVRTLAAVRPFGHVSSIGQVTGPSPTLPLSEIGPSRSLSLSRPSILRFLSDLSLYARATKTLFEKIDQGLKVPHPRTFRLEDAAKAQQLLESGQSSGTIALVC